MSEFIQPFDLQQYKKIMQVSVASFMLFLAGCGPLKPINITDSISAQTSGPVLSDKEASCNGKVTTDVEQARQQDALFMEEQLQLSRDTIKKEMASFCDGLIPPTP